MDMPWSDMKTPLCLLNGNTSSLSLSLGPHIKGLLSFLVKQKNIPSLHSHWLRFQHHFFGSKSAVNETPAHIHPHPIPQKKCEQKALEEKQVSFGYNLSGSIPSPLNVAFVWVSTDFFWFLYPSLAKLGWVIIIKIIRITTAWVINHVLFTRHCSQWLNHPRQDDESQSQMKKRRHKRLLSHTRKGLCFKSPSR